jgi:hypothetical protein
MRSAKDFLSSAGWEKIRDTSANSPYDYYCENGDASLYVEVKGTTSNGDTIVLTRREVEHHRKVHPRNAIVVVSGVRLAPGNPPVASGGKVRMCSPWEIQDAGLTVVSYLYDMPPSEAVLPAPELLR